MSRSAVTGGQTAADMKNDVYFEKIEMLKIRMDWM